MQQWGMSQEQVARVIGKSQSAVANKLRILKHGAHVLEALREGNLTERHARALLKLSTEEEKLVAIAHIVRHQMGVAQAEQYIESLFATQEPKKPRANVSAFLNHLDHSLTKMQKLGIPAVSERRETEKEIVLTITIPK